MNIYYSSVEKKMTDLIELLGWGEQTYLNFRIRAILDWTDSKPITCWDSGHVVCISQSKHAIRTCLTNKIAMQNLSTKRLPRHLILNLMYSKQNKSPTCSILINLIWYKKSPRGVASCNHVMREVDSLSWFTIKTHLSRIFLVKLSQNIYK